MPLEASDRRWAPASSQGRQGRCRVESRQFRLTASPLGGDLRAHAISGGLEPARLSRNERRDASMNRENLVVLHAAMSTVLAWPPAVLDEIARWLAPAAAKPNGHDPHPPNGKDLDPPPIASPSPRSPATPHAGKDPPRPIAGRGKDRRAAPRGATGRPGPERRQVGRRCQDQSIDCRRPPARARRARACREGRRRPMAGSRRGRRRGWSRALRPPL